MASSEANLPPCQVLLRSKHGIEVFQVSSNRDDVMEPRSGERQFLVKGGTAYQTMAPDGSCAFVLMTGHGVVRVPLTGAPPQEPITKSSPTFLANSSTIQMMEISPMGSYLVTWQRVTESEPNNLKVWCASTGEFLIGFPQKGLKREAWPYVQWTADEVFAMHMTTNEVRIFPGDAFAKDKQEARYVEKARAPGVTSMSVPRQRGGALASTPYRFTTFCPGDKNKPAKATLHEYDANNTHTVLMSKSLFQAEDMKTNWSPNGNIALITLQTSVDASGKSYYGSATLFLLGSDNDAKAVPLPQDGPVMDVSWMPNATKSPCFVVIAGRMPAMASMHHGLTAEPLFLFGNAHRNTISWAPHGRFVCVAGFGNLAGGMSFWDRNKLKLIPPTGQNTASCTVGFGWSPDSRLFGVSTTTPRMNVDNGYRLFRYNGEQITNVPWTNENYLPDKLLEACFVPALPTVYPDRPQSPTLKAEAAAPAAAAPDAKPAGRYIPPSQRGKQTGGKSLAERMQKQKETQMKGAQVVAGQPKKAVSAATGKVIPGLVVAPNDGKTKSAMKREKQKLAKQRKAEEEEAKKQQEEAAAPPAEAVDPEKRARKIKKTLKQIDDLKQKDPGALNEDQQNKIASEASLREELASLGV
ncbi:Eukaryotic translation initiation factor 2A [Seminavis robusta]|uniref:Eukaryotic translation initiation factor 2A n=1 Tax=Seminavis robusta TaxID=568900 RepID=A0A9N8HV93_9STRA|nr:Eukaryotic translation initiation factor 2A [Seminavis robusta]|eukprot:Sro1764_g296090.1 Eukaryotic translation initiation factor 2A (639) ;mRNA; f:13301-15217